MSATILLEFVSLFFAGILAGVEIVIHYGLRAPAATLDERAQLALRRALVFRLRVLVPAFFVPAALAAIAVTVVDGGARGFDCRGAALAAIAVWTATRVIGTVGINSATIEWQPSAPPANWRALVDRAERFHIVGVWAAVAAYALLLTAVALRLTTPT
jgi:hypothetical protein